MCDICPIADDQEKDGTGSKNYVTIPKSKILVSITSNQRKSNLLPVIDAVPPSKSYSDSRKSV